MFSHLHFPNGSYIFFQKSPYMRPRSSNQSSLPIIICSIAAAFRCTFHSTNESTTTGIDHHTLLANGSFTTHGATIFLPNGTIRACRFHTQTSFVTCTLAPTNTLADGKKPLKHALLTDSGYWLTRNSQNARPRCPSPAAKWMGNHP